MKSLNWDLNLQLLNLDPGRDSMLNACRKWSTKIRVGSQVSIRTLDAVFHNSYMNFHESYVVFQNNYMNFQLFNLDPGRDCLLNVFGKWSTQNQVGS